jgi:hypothetical protein
MPSISNNITQEEFEDMVAEMMANYDLDAEQASPTDGLTEKGWFDSLPPEKQYEYLTSMGAGDAEFELEAASYGGDRIKKNLSAGDFRVASRDSSNVAARYFQDTPSPQDEEFNRLNTGAGGLIEGQDPMAPGEILMARPEGMDPQTQSHELMHKSDDKEGKFVNSTDNQKRAMHDYIHVFNAYQARTKEEWRDVVRAFAAYVGYDNEADAEKHLKKLVELNAEQFALDEAAAGEEGQYAKPEGMTYQEQALEMYARRKKYQDLNFN